MQQCTCSMHRMSFKPEVLPSLFYYIYYSSFIIASVICQLYEYWIVYKNHNIDPWDNLTN